MKTLKHLWAHHKCALTGFVLACAAVLYFGFTTLASAIYWMDPAHQDQALADWMTPRYVGQSYHLPRDVIEDVFMLERGIDPPRIRLGQIAENNDMTMADLQARLDAAHAAFEANREAERDE